MVRFDSSPDRRRDGGAGARYAAIAVVAFALATPAYGVEQKSASAGEVRALLYTSATTAFAGTQGGGLFKSTNTGANWSPVAGFPARYVWSLAASGDGTLYAATTWGLYKSTDGATGAAWAALTLDDTRAVAVSGSGASALVLAGVRGAGVQRSTNGGASFSDFSNGLDSLDVRSIAISGNDAYLGAYNIFYIDVQTAAKTSSNVGGVFKAVNAGTASAWTNINTQGSVTLDSKFVTAVAVDGAGVLYAATREPEGAGTGSVHRLAGGSWNNPCPSESAGCLFDVETLAVDRAVATNVWAGSRALGPYKWNGTQWVRQINIGTDPDLLTGVTAIATNGSGAALAGTRGIGVMFSPTGASPWDVGLGLKSDRVLAWTSHDTASPNTYYVALRGGGVMRSTDGGAAWAEFNNGFNPVGGAPTLATVNAIAGNPSNTNEIYATFEGFGLYEWNGFSWVVSPDTGHPTPANPQNLIYPNSTSLLYSDLFFGMGVFRRDAANMWTLRTTGEFAGAGIGKVRRMANPSTFFATTYDFLPYISTDGGITWTQVPAANAPHLGFMRLAFLAVADKPGGGRTLAATNKGLYGALAPTGTWVRYAATGLPTTVLSGLAYTASARAWATTRDGGLYCSNNDGIAWIGVNQPFPAVIVDLVARNNELFLLTDGAGLLRHDGTTCP